MFKRFFWLEWKSFFRSASFGKSLGLKIFLIFIALYFSAMFLLFGFGLYPIMKKIFPDKDPVQMVNQFALIYFAMEFVLRFMLQTLPVMDIKPLMIFPIKKRKVVNYVLLKSLYSFYNILPLFIILPFGIFNIYKGTHGAGVMIGWMIAMYSITLSVNFLNFIVKKRFTDNLKALIPLVILAVGLVLLDYFEIFSITYYFGKLLNFLLIYPYLAIVPVLVLIGLYLWNQRNLESKFYLDAGLKGKAKSANTKDFGWTRKFGSIAPFLQLDLKLIWRNKRPKTTVYLGVIFLAYGLIFYMNPAYANFPQAYVFAGIFTTGIFMINFGQFVPSWDASYFPMIMAQNIPLRQYLASKMGLITFSIAVLGILSTGYVYFGYKVLIMNVACALYNMGVNVPLLIYAGSFNKKRIDLDKSPFMNYQGTGAAQWLVALPLLIIPIFLFWLVNKFFGYEVGVGLLALLGIIGLVVRPSLLTFLESCYRKRKYAMIQGFKQKGE